MGGADGSAAPTRSPLAEWLLRNRKSRVCDGRGCWGGASSLKLDAAMRLLRVGGARDQSASPGAEPVGHVVRRVQRSAKEQREEAALEADRAERERIRRVVTEADEAETAERRRLRDQARLVCRAAKTARMIETHEASEARRRRASRRARARGDGHLASRGGGVPRALETPPELEREPRPEPRPKAPTRSPPSPRRSFTDATSRVRRSRRAGGVVCVTPVDTTGTSECELTRRLHAPDEEDPRTAWHPRGTEPGAEPGAETVPTRNVRHARRSSSCTSARRAARSRRGSSERRGEAKVATTELSLARRRSRAASRRVALSRRHHLKITRNRIINLPDDLGDALPCLETLEVRAMRSRGSRVGLGPIASRVPGKVFRTFFERLRIFSERSVPVFFPESRLVRTLD